METLNLSQEFSGLKIRVEFCSFCRRLCGVQKIKRDTFICEECIEIRKEEKQAKQPEIKEIKINPPIAKPVEKTTQSIPCIQGSKKRDSCKPYKHVKKKKEPKPERQTVRGAILKLFEENKVLSNTEIISLLRENTYLKSHNVKCMKNMIAKLVQEKILVSKRTTNNGKKTGAVYAKDIKDICIEDDNESNQNKIIQILKKRDMPVDTQYLAQHLKIHQHNIPKVIRHKFIRKLIVTFDIGQHYFFFYVDKATDENIKLFKEKYPSARRVEFNYSQYYEERRIQKKPEN